MYYRAYTILITLYMLTLLIIMLECVTVQGCLTGFVQWTSWAAGNLSEESAEDVRVKERD